MHYESDGSDGIISIPISHHKSPGKPSNKNVVKGGKKLKKSGSRNSSLLPNISEHYENTDGKRNAGFINSTTKSHDDPNFSVFVGKDIFAKFESSFPQNSN